MSDTTLTLDDAIVIDDSEEPHNPFQKACRSSVWLDFEKKLNNKGVIVAICNHCNKTLGATPGNTTSHLRNHLKRCKLKKFEEARRPLISDTINPNDDAHLVKAWKFNQERSCANLGRMVIKHEYQLLKSSMSTFKRLSTIFNLNSSLILGIH
ncbi:hypothetical protein GIB67_032354 [Kingdonia uniflora]|uniref:BED-type domain-containing protein n=1 Tax=Kingdonia uniflora TaxID=39325 RepID=A0A7J7MIU7_9MAGN|nr:hypothetical protein GIB67_032354 [Kingdonia uniflora]